MKAISLWQPWASLVAVAAKQIETRSWATQYRGPLVIHAALKWDARIREIAAEPRMRNLLAIDRWAIEYPYRLTRGAAVALVDLVDVADIRSDCMIGQTDWKTYPLPTGNELLFGNYTPGRYAWLFQNIRKLKTPVLLKGRQQLWTLKPEEIAAIEAAL